MEEFLFEWLGSFKTTALLKTIFTLDTLYRVPAERYRWRNIFFAAMLVRYSKIKTTDQPLAAKGKFQDEFLFWKPRSRKRYMEKICVIGGLDP